MSSRKVPAYLADGTDVGSVSAHALSILAVDTAMLAKAIAEKAAAEASEAKVIARGNTAALNDMSELIGGIGKTLGDLVSTTQALVDLVNGIRKDLEKRVPSQTSD